MHVKVSGNDRLYRKDSLTEMLNGVDCRVFYFKVYISALHTIKFGYLTVIVCKI